MSLRKLDAPGVKKRVIVEIEGNGPGREATYRPPPCQATQRSPCAYRSKPKLSGRL